MKSWGIKAADGTLAECDSTGCTDCAADFETCDACNVVTGHYLNSTVCVHQSGIEEGWGIKSADGTLAACTTTGCLECPTNYLTCQICDPSIDYYLNSSTCVHTSGIEDGWGIKAAEGTLAECS